MFSGIDVCMPLYCMVTLPVRPAELVKLPVPNIAAMARYVHPEDQWGLPSRLPWSLVAPSFLGMKPTCNFLSRKVCGTHIRTVHCRILEEFRHVDSDAPTCRCLGKGQDQLVTAPSRIPGWQHRRQHVPGECVSRRRHDIEVELELLAAAAVVLHAAIAAVQHEQRLLLRRVLPESPAAVSDNAAGRRGCGGVQGLRETMWLPAPRCVDGVAGGLGPLCRRQRAVSGRVSSELTLSLPHLPHWPDWWA